MDHYKTRLPWIDYLKAIAIVAVVATHAGPSPWLPGAGMFDRALRGSLAIFHVPSFLVVAGFLYGPRTVLSVRDLGRRLKRIVPPYAIASALVFTIGLARPTSTPDALFMLVTGSTLGIYYFVFVLTSSVVLTFILTQASPKLPYYALGGCILWWFLRPLFVELPTVAPTTPRFWFFRNPWWSYPYFLVGWTARQHSATVRDWLDSYRIPLAIAAMGLVAVHVFTWPVLRATALGPFAHFAYVLAVIGLIVVATRHARVPVGVRFLSESSYTIYLYHFLCISPVVPATLGVSPPLRAVGLTIVGLLGGAGVAYLGRRLLGVRSRLLLGS